jgi:hypothetical protein
MFFPMLGLIGYEELKNTNKWLIKHPKFFKTSFKIFLVVNFILLVPITLTYSKKSRVEAMYYLKDEPQENKNVLIFGAGRIRDVTLMPVFYTDYESYPSYYKVSTEEEVVQLMDTLSTMPIDRQPDYLIMVEHETLEDKIKQFEQRYDLEFKTSIDASFIDKTMHWLNPRNKNYDMRIYKVTGIKSSNQPISESE